MSTISSLPGEWSYLYQSPPELNSDGAGFNARVTFLTRYFNLVPFVLVVSGTPQTVTDSAGNAITRVVPLQHPLYSGLWATKIASKAFGTPSETSPALIDLYSHAEVTVDFASVPYGTDGSDQPYMTMDIKEGGSTRPSPAARWSSRTTRSSGRTRACSSARRRTASRSTSARG